jgi:hypothetical protein
VIAVIARGLIHKILIGLTIGKFVRQGGDAFVVDPSRRLRATSVVAVAVSWFAWQRQYASWSCRSLSRRRAVAVEPPVSAGH